MKASSCRDRVEQALARIADPNGEGARACLSVYADGARAAADAADARRERGSSLGPLDGAIISIKDLFDVAGEPTRAGSRILADEAAPAAVDAPVVQRLRRAGAAIVAKTNMSEFAFSGIGANPHFGTPGNPHDRQRAPGGSSAGAPVAVADGMCEISIGTDTGGSVRVPAALCGLVGFKPSRQRVPTEGAFPLSRTLDSIGPIARSVADCAKADAIMAGEEFVPLEPIALVGLRFGVAEGLPLGGLDDIVSPAFAKAIGQLDDAGVRISRETLSSLDDMMAVNDRGGVVPPEACALHRDRLRRRAADVDPNVRVRIERGCGVAEADYADMLRERARLVGVMDTRVKDLDVLVMPTCAIVAPVLADIADAKAFAARNAAVLRNTSIINFFDLCAITLPLSAALPVGLMLVARNGHDRRLLRIAAAVTPLLGA
jgi:aspartyl-tRNA(Asn)/glutamyl-tRNA(Gln) amidotransferase subunit A